METDFLQGRTALITGGNRGLGKAIALALGSAGARLALVARDRLPSMLPPLKSAEAEPKAKSRSSRPT
jgi:NAD(P)-dependent dehydrogenase (short-subunit alcohol dehydrogenase family)